MDADCGILSIDAQRESPGGAGLDFDLAVRQLHRDGLEPLPDLTVVEAEAVSPDPARALGLQARRVPPVLGKADIRESEPLENAALLLGFFLGALRGRD